MVAYAFSTQGKTPQYGGGGGLPPAKYKGVIVDVQKRDVEKMGQIVGSYMELTLTPVEGPLAGQKQIDRLNLQNRDARTVEIAEKQLTAYCYVTGNPGGFQDTEQLKNKPFVFEVGFQIDKDTKQPTSYTEVKQLFDVNGVELSKLAGGGASAGPVSSYNPNQGPPPAGVAPEGGGWNGGGQGGGPPPQQQQQFNQGQGQNQQGGGWGGDGGQQQQQNQGQGGWGGGAPPQQQQQQQPPPQDQGQAGGWGNNQGGPPPQQQQQQPPPQQGGAQGNWGAGGGQAQGNPNGAAWGAR